MEGIVMSVCPVLTNVRAQLRRHYDAGVADGTISPMREFRTWSESVGANGKRRYFVADDSGQPIRSLGSVEATPTIAD